MPCQNSNHHHKWPRSGLLSIAKCENIYGFCQSHDTNKSVKLYKPASALRKHVARHIKNSNLQIELEKCGGGRPRLQMTLVSPASGSTEVSELPNYSHHVECPPNDYVSQYDDLQQSPHDQSKDRDILGCQYCRKYASTFGPDFRCLPCLSRKNGMSLEVQVDEYITSINKAILSGTWTFPPSSKEQTLLANVNHQMHACSLENSSGYQTLVIRT